MFSVSELRAITYPLGFGAHTASVVRLASLKVELSSTARNLVVLVGQAPSIRTPISSTAAER